jgi:hypothetical protein
MGSAHLTFLFFFQVTENKLLTIAGMDKWVDNWVGEYKWRLDLFV